MAVQILSNSGTSVDTTGAAMVVIVDVVAVVGTVGGTGEVFSTVARGAVVVDVVVDVAVTIGENGKGLATWQISFGQLKTVTIVLATQETPKDLKKPLFLLEIQNASALLMLVEVEGKFEQRLTH